MGCVSQKQTADPPNPLPNNTYKLPRTNKDQQLSNNTSTIDPNIAITTTPPIPNQVKDKPDSLILIDQIQDEPEPNQSRSIQQMKENNKFVNNEEIRGTRSPINIIYNDDNSDEGVGHGRMVDYPLGSIIPIIQETQPEGFDSTNVAKKLFQNHEESDCKENGWENSNKHIGDLPRENSVNLERFIVQSNRSNKHAEFGEQKIANLFQFCFSLPLIQIPSKHAK